MSANKSSYQENNLSGKRIKKIPSIKLSSYTNDKNIVYQPFVYAKVDGIAELIGWQIILFRRSGLVNGISVISIEDMDIPVIKDICAQILKDLDLPFSVGMNIDSVQQLLGLYSYTDNMLEDIVQYCFVMPHELICCGLHAKKGLCEVEIVYDEEIKIKRIESYL